MIVAILLMNTALALCDTIDMRSNYLYISSLDDSYVSSLAPTTNYGSATTMKAQLEYYYSYIKFDISSISSIDINSVKLRIFFNKSIEGTLYINKVDSNSWDEDTVVYNSRPLMGDNIDTITVSYPYCYYDIDVTDWVNDRITNEQTLVSFGFNANSEKELFTKEDGTPENVKPLLIVNYGNTLDTSDSNLKSIIYNYANVTTVDSFNNIYYSDNIITYEFVGSESNTTYTNIGSDDGNYHRLTSVSGSINMGYRFETQIEDVDINEIQKIEITYKGLNSFASGSSYAGGFRTMVYDYNNSAYINENEDVYNNLIYNNLKMLWTSVTPRVIHISNGFENYIDEDGVLKVVLYFVDTTSTIYNFDIYYYQVKVYYSEPVTPPVVDPDDPIDPGDPPVYPDLTDDTPIISVDGEYTGDLQNVLFRNLFQLNDKIGIPTWSLILLGGLIGVWKRRPELVIFCGLLFMFLLFFGYKLAMAVI